jgi:predicted Rossmann fold flavoprotein
VTCDVDSADIAIVGAGAAGLATAIFARRANPTQSVLLLDGARMPGAKILVSGGSRCNVTNRVVSETDFWGGRRSLIKRVLRAFTADDTVRFFRDLNVPLHEEADGKLFPDTNKARDVLHALLRAVDDAGVRMRANHRVVSLAAVDGGFRIATTHGDVHCRRAVLATGGQSLPRSGSDGLGFTFAAALGHKIVPTTPALAPLVLEGSSDAMHRQLAGVSHDVELSIWVDGRIATRLRGPLLWTHFGISGPVALNASRHWLRALTEKREAAMTANFCPAETFESVEQRWAATTSTRPKSSIVSIVAALVPASVAAALLERVRIDASRPLAHVTRNERRALIRALVEWPLPVKDSRGYSFAEATAGGVSLDEVDMATMESRVCPGLFLVGEVLDVDGRIGGFNFQWAWSTGYVAGRALGGRSA